MSNTLNIEIAEGVVYGNRYRVGQLIGHGAFGYVFKSFDFIMHRRVALKFESRKSQDPRRSSQLFNEATILFKLNTEIGFPHITVFDQAFGHNVIVMSYLGDDLEKLFDRCKRRFSLKTVLLLADQMMERIKCLHDRGILHRDLKPENFAIGRGSRQRLLHIVDFGLGYPILDNQTTTTSPVFVRRRKLIGTLVFASLTACRGCKQSRRDDLESIFYTLAYFYLGELPWGKLNFDNKKLIREEVTAMKMELDYLLEQLPREFRLYINHCRRTGYRQNPDYDYLRGLFRDLYAVAINEKDPCFDWENTPEYQSELQFDIALEDYEPPEHMLISKRHSIA